MKLVQKSIKNLVGFLGDLKTPKFHSEINWPLVFFEIYAVPLVQKIWPSLKKPALWNLKLFLYIKNVKSPISNNLSLEPLVFNFFYQKTCSEKYFSVKADASGVNLTAESITIKNNFKDQLEQSLNQSPHEELHEIRDKVEKI